MSILSVKNLEKKFGDLTVLKNISFNINDGEIISIIGSSGSGKSTLLRCMNQLETITSGTITIDGKTLVETKNGAPVYAGKDILKDILMETGFVFQHFNLFPHYSVLRNVMDAPVCVAGVPKKQAEEKARELLKKLGLETKADAYPCELSGGQKQRVAIARALASDPKILLCDEATSALDPQTTSSILALLKDINQRFNITIVIITHQMSVVREICSHVAIVKGGEVAEQGTVEDIFTHPKTAVARELLKNDVGDDGEEKRGTTAGGKEIIKSGEKIRIVFSENSAFEPVIANLILNFNEPVNILKADTKNVGGVAKGEMVLEFAPDCTKNKEMKQYLLERGLEIEEVSEYVD